MITVLLNGAEKTLETTCVLCEAIRQWGYDGDSYAIAINETFVPRSCYGQTALQQGDSIEVVSPLQGG